MISYIKTAVFPPRRCRLFLKFFVGSKLFIGSKFFVSSKLYIGIKLFFGLSDLEIFILVSLAVAFVASI
jgi:hypothetical protein